MSARSLPPAVPVAALRVYEPVDVFPARQGARWTAELHRPDAGERAAEAERRESWRRLVRGARGVTPGAPPGPGEGRPVGAEGTDRLAGHVRVLRVDGAVLLCPSSLGDGDGDGPRRTLVRAWALPPSWLAVVALGAGRAPDGGRAPGRYLTPMARARAQAARALRTVRHRLEGSDVAVELEVLGRWLEGFHPRSWLELDVRAVVAVLDGDDGVDDVRLILECLASGDVRSATSAYHRLRRRSRALTDISRLS